MAEHTPGPWEWECDGDPPDSFCSFALFAPNMLTLPERVIVHIENDYLHVRPADARLIAAAPDMLAALERVLHQENYEPGAYPTSGTVEAVEVAIAKARGTDD